jgi:hypothetical protein
MNSLPSNQRNQFAFLAIGFIVILFAALFVTLLEAKPGEVAAALASILGGLIGAAGAALAVYLTLKGQRDDESASTISAILSEVAELSKFPVGQLGFCGQVQIGNASAPKSALPTIMHTPEAVIYPALPARIARLPKPTVGSGLTI